MVRSLILHSPAPRVLFRLQRIFQLFANHVGRQHLRVVRSRLDLEFPIRESEGFSTLLLMFHVGMVVVAAIAITIVGIAVVLLAFSVALAPPVSAFLRPRLFFLYLFLLQLPSLRNSRMTASDLARPICGLILRGDSSG
jgi:hypothetical protein